MFNQKQKITIAVSFGLVLLVIFHSVTTAFLNRAAPYVEQAVYDAIENNRVPVGGISFDSSKNASTHSTMPVNSSARDELKKQDCATCVPVNRVPSPLSVVPRVIQPTAKATADRSSISIFVSHNDAQSQRLLSWFNSYQTLSNVKTRVNYHVYTKDNPLYRARYSASIPADRFPVVMYTSPKGGVVYIADRNSLPSDPGSLVSEIRASIDIHNKAVSASRNMPVVTPKIQLVSHTVDPCPDGECDPSQVPPDQANGILDLFRDQDRNRGLGFGDAIRDLNETSNTLIWLIVAIGAAIAFAIFLKRIQ